MLKCTLCTLQRQIQDFPKGGAWVDAGIGSFMLGHFEAGHITRCTDKMWADKILGDKTPVKIARGDKMLPILRDKEGKMPILSKHLIYDTDGQVN